MTTSTSTSVPSREELVERAAGLRGLLAEHAAEADRNRVVNDSVIEAVTEAGLFRLMVPKRFGGYETDAMTFLEVVTELGKGCLSTSWVVSVNNFASFQLGAFGDQAQQDVWGDNPDARLTWVLSPMAKLTPVDGGWTVDGRWPNASGSAHADWAGLVLPMEFGPQGPVFGIAYIPMGEVTIEDSWHVAGVRGSASNTVVAQGAFLPEHRLLPLMELNEGMTRNEHPEEALYRSIYSIGGVGLVAPLLGTAKAMLELVLDGAQGKMIPAAGVMDQSEWTSFQLEAAEAATKIQAAWLMAKNAAEEIDAAAESGERPDILTRARIRNEMSWATNQLKEAADILMTEAGVSAFADSVPLQRMWRDISTGGRHTGFRMNPTREMYAKALLGKEVGPILLG